jgi:drug/metabolite transporter (DMT)-like permease
MDSETIPPRLDLVALGLGVAFALMWSSAFSSARIIVADAPPLMSLALRFLISGVIGVGLALALGQHWRLTGPQWRATILFGLCQNALYLGLYFVAMQTVEASLAAIIASALPLVVAAAGWAFLGARLTWVGFLGLLAGFAGVALILGGRIGAGAVDAFGLVLCILGVGALAFATLALRGASAGGNVLMVVGLQMLVGAAALAPVALLLETPEVRWSPALVAAFLYTVFVPGLLATWVWFVLVRRIGAVKAAAFHFLNPFFGVAIAALILGERLGPWDVVGVAVVMGAILAVQLARPPAR